jgi:hypothetical protein
MRQNEGILLLFCSFPLCLCGWIFVGLFGFPWVCLLDDSCAFVCTTKKANSISVVTKPTLIRVKKKKTQH